MICCSAGDGKVGVVCMFSRLLKLSETIDDMVAYTKVNDSLLLKILHSTEPRLQQARKVLENVECRRMYRFIGQTNPKPGREDVMVTTVLSVSHFICLIH